MYVGTRYDITGNCHNGNIQHPICVSNCSIVKVKKQNFRIDIKIGEVAQNGDSYEK